MVGYNIYRMTKTSPQLLYIFSINWLSCKIRVTIVCNESSEKGALVTSAMRFRSTVPVVDMGSLAKDPSLLMELITKFCSRVKFVIPTLSELSITNTMSTAPQCFSQSDTRGENRISGFKETVKWSCVRMSFIFAHHNIRTSPWCNPWHHTPAVTGAQVKRYRTKEVKSI